MGGGLSSQARAAGLSLMFIKTSETRRFPAFKRETAAGLSADARKSRWGI